MNEDLVRHLAEKNHEVWRTDPANAKSRFNVPFSQLPQPQQDSALNDVRVVLQEYERVMAVSAPKPEPVEVEPAKPKPLPPKGKLEAVIEKVLPPRQKAEDLPQPTPEAQTSPEEPTLTKEKLLPANEVPQLQRIDEALRVIAQDLNALPEVEKRRLSTLAVQSIAFNSSKGDFFVATGLLQRATLELPNFFNSVIAQRKQVE